MSDSYQKMKEYYTDIIDEDFNKHYEREDRKNEIIEMVDIVSASFELDDLNNSTILELAGGGGFWTNHLLNSYDVISLDQNVTELNKPTKSRFGLMDLKVIETDLLDMKAFEEILRGKTFIGTFASCWVSHIKRVHLINYLKNFKDIVKNILHPDGSIVFIDSLYREDGPPIYGGTHNPLVDTFQKRTMKDGSEVEIIKNFYRISEWTKFLEDTHIGKIVEYKEWKHYYLLKWKV